MSYIIPDDCSSYPAFFKNLGNKYYGDILNFKNLTSKIEDGEFYYGITNNDTGEREFKRASSKVQIYLRTKIKPIHECHYTNQEIAMLKADIPKDFLEEIEENSSTEEAVLSMSVCKTIAATLTATNSDYCAEIIENLTKKRIPVEADLWMNESGRGAGFSTVTNNGSVPKWYEQTNGHWRVIVHKGTLVITKNVREQFQIHPASTKTVSGVEEKELDKSANQATSPQNISTKHVMTAKSNLKQSLQDDSKPKDKKGNIKTHQSIVDTPKKEADEYTRVHDTSLNQAYISQNALPYHNLSKQQDLSKSTSESLQSKELTSSAIEAFKPSFPETRFHSDLLRAFAREYWVLYTKTGSEPHIDTIIFNVTNYWDKVLRDDKCTKSRKEEAQRLSTEWTNKKDGKRWLSDSISKTVRRYYKEEFFKV